MIYGQVSQQVLRNKTRISDSSVFQVVSHKMQNQFEAEPGSKAGKGDKTQGEGVGGICSLTHCCWCQIILLNWLHPTIDPFQQYLSIFWESLRRRLVLWHSFVREGVGNFCVLSAWLTLNSECQILLHLTSFFFWSKHSSSEQSCEGQRAMQ